MNKVWSKSDIKSSAAPVIFQNVLYSAQDEKLCAYDPATGDEIWVYTTPGKVTAPAFFDDLIFLGGHNIDNYFYVLDRNNGKEIKRVRLGPFMSAVHATPAIADGQVILSAGRTVWAFDIESFKPNWKCKLSGRTHYFPVTVGCEKVFALTNDGPGKIDIICCDLKSGQLLWKKNVPLLASPLSLIENEILFLDRENFCHRVNIENGESSKFAILKDAPENRKKAYILREPDRLIFTIGYHLLCLNTQAGKYDWTFHSQGLLGKPMVKDEKIYFSNCYDGIRCLDMATGKLLFHIPSEVRSEYAVALDDEGRLFCAGSMNEYELTAYR